MGNESQSCLLPAAARLLEFGGPSGLAPSTLGEGGGKVGVGVRLQAAEAQQARGRTHGCCLGPAACGPSPGSYTQLGQDGRRQWPHTGRAPLAPGPLPLGDPPPVLAPRYSGLRSGRGCRLSATCLFSGWTLPGSVGPLPTEEGRAAPGGGRREAGARPVQQGAGGGCSASLSTLLQRLLLRQV